MRYYQRYHGVVLKNSNGLPSIRPTPEGEAIASIPDWVDYLDPDELNLTPDWVRNRAVENSLYAASGVPVVTQFPNGTTAFTMTNAANYNVTADAASLPIDPTKFTVFAVMMPTAVQSELNENLIVRGNSESTGPELGLRIGATRVSGNLFFKEFSSGNNTGASTPNPERLSAATNYIGRPRPSLAMWCSSIVGGLNIFDNGALAASAPNDKRVITLDMGTGQRSYFRGARGRYGVCGILNRDLSLPENEGYRLAIEQYLFARYSILA